MNKLPFENPNFRWKKYCCNLILVGEEMGHCNLDFFWNHEKKDCKNLSHSEIFGNQAIEKQWFLHPQTKCNNLTYAKGFDDYE